LSTQGRVFVVLQNRAPIALEGIRVTPALVDAAGRVVQTAPTVYFDKPIAPGDREARDAGIGALTQEQMAALRFRIDGARVVEQ
jgi:hypothetical protein